MFFAFSSVFSKYRSINSVYGSPYDLLGVECDFNKVRIGKRIRKNNTVVTFIKDASGNVFCIKQTHKGSRSELLLIFEVLGSYIAESANIPMNIVRLLPLNCQLPGKFFYDELATLHTKVDGLNCRSAFSCKIYLQQYLRAHLPVQLKGLCRRVIHDMSLHPDLPKIVALDTFISNPDRSSNNLFYNNQTKRFCGIDMELAFKLPLRRNLSKIAYYHIQQLFDNNVTPLQRQELIGLSEYNKTLKVLIKRNNPERTYTILKELLCFAGLAKIKIQKGNRNISINKKHRDYIKVVLKNIEQQYQDVQLLTSLIDTLIDKYIKNKKILI